MSRAATSGPSAGNRPEGLMGDAGFLRRKVTEFREIKYDARELTVGDEVASDALQYTSGEERLSAEAPRRWSRCRFRRGRKSITLICDRRENPADEWIPDEEEGRTKNRARAILWRVVLLHCPQFWQDTARRPNVQAGKNRHCPLTRWVESWEGIRVRNASYTIDRGES